jgi:hypothetical protein
MMADDVYLIWSNEHRAWWGPGRCGYDRHLSMAGRYTRAQAVEICRDAIPTAMHIGMISEIPVRLEDVHAFLEGGMIPAGVL